MLSKYHLPRWIIYIILVGSGAASFYYIPTLFGIDFLIGSFLTFLLYRLFGFRVALIHSIIFAYATFYIWGHIYGSTAMLLEFLTVVFLYKKFRQSLIMADMIYWLLFGIPFIFLTYFYLLDLSLIDSLIVALKDTVNGVVNILLANLLLFTISYFLLKKHRQKVYLEDIIFHTILIFFLIPSLALLLFEMSSDSADMQRQIQSDSQEGYEEAQNQLNIWLNEVTTVLSSQGNFIYSADRFENDDYLGMLTEAVWGAEEVVLLDNAMNVVASYPENRKHTMDMSDYPELNPDQARYSPFYYDEADEPYVIVTVPLSKSDENADEESLYFAASIDMNEWRQLYSNDHTTVFDQTGKQMNEIVDADDNQFYQSIQRTFAQGNNEELSFLWMPSDEGTKISNWKNATYVTMGVNEYAPWTVTSTISTSPYHMGLFTQHLYRLIFISFILALSIFLSTVITKKILRPIRELELITKNLPERVRNNQTITWPKTRLIDIQLLIINFRRMTNKLGDAFDEVSDQKSRLAQLAKYDPLTNLQNRLGIEESYLAYIEDGSSLSAAFMDLDHFKDINDTLGHGIGDQVLTEVANRLKKVSPEGATPGRLGGDEFIVLLPETNEEKLRKFGERVLKAFEAPVIIEGHTIHLTPSIGLAPVPAQGNDFKTLVQHADTAMYESKRNGKNQATVFGN
ncbi:diguanylate cyclase domain-containing protein [Jeotgalibacillus terrae]|uniref:Diguanylate cyclase domain-containing protein n=1 Tax=Jeotgalibacillus terrae TaxID=587735 RepID=A0ABW5ZLS6_9BACL|nr:diguanylate cyclase (GGDEF)-like protein [Jeotgalibacillus terrae]